MRYLIFQQPIKSYNKSSSQFFRKIIKENFGNIITNK